jgi:hypothetical protein
MTTRSRIVSLPALALSSALLLGAAACDDEEENTGEACEVADDCFDGLDDRDMIAGEIECLDRVEDGYCTHRCETDEDCCAVEGECRTDHPQVCAPFENESSVKRCFLSCEPAVVGDQDEGDYCREFANDEFGCRSTGGGDQNRKVCVPPG